MARKAWKWEQFAPVVTVTWGSLLTSQQSRTEPALGDKQTHCPQAQWSTSSIQACLWRFHSLWSKGHTLRTECSTTWAGGGHFQLKTHNSPYNLRKRRKGVGGAVMGDTASHSLGDYSTQVSPRESVTLPFLFHRWEVKGEGGCFSGGPFLEKVFRDFHALFPSLKVKC